MRAIDMNFHPSYDVIFFGDTYTTLCLLFGIGNSDSFHVHAPYDHIMILIMTFESRIKTLHSAVTNVNRYIQMFHCRMGKIIDDKCVNIDKCVKIHFKKALTIAHEK